MAIAERSMNRNDGLKLSRPVPRWEYDALDLAMHEADAMHATGRVIPRPIDEVAMVNRDWETTVYTNLAYIRWAEDYYKLDPQMRASLERNTEQAAT